MLAPRSNLETRAPWFGRHRRQRHDYAAPRKTVALPFGPYHATQPKGTSRVRVSAHANLTDGQLDRLSDAIPTH
jgi:hypothetical protein